MDKETHIFHDEYTTESSTDTPSEPPNQPPKRKKEEKQQEQTVSGQTDYDKSKPRRVIIKAREIEQ